MGSALDFRECVRWVEEEEEEVGVGEILKLLKKTESFESSNGIVSVDMSVVKENQGWLIKQTVAV